MSIDIGLWIEIEDVAGETEVVVFVSWRMFHENGEWSFRFKKKLVIINL